MKVRFTPRAKRRSLAVVTWWRVNRKAAPDLFERELEEIKQRLADQPELGMVYERIGDLVIRRVLLEKSEQHVYWSVDRTTNTVIIHVIWGARKGRGPKF